MHLEPNLPFLRDEGDTDQGELFNLAAVTTTALNDINGNGIEMSGESKALDQLGFTQSALAYDDGFGSQILLTARVLLKTPFYRSYRRKMTAAAWNV